MGKLENKPYIVMDINAIPINHGLNAEDWMKILNEEKIVLYDGEEGNEPKIYSSEEGVELKVIDVNSKEFKEYGK